MSKAQDFELFINFWNILTLLVHNVATSLLINGRLTKWLPTCLDNSRTVQLQLTTRKISDCYLASGESSNKSEDGFMVVDCIQDCMEPVQPPKAKTQVKQWLKSCTAGIANNLTKPLRSKETRFKDKINSKGGSQGPLYIINLISTPDTTITPQVLVPGIKIYSITISELPKAATIHDSGYLASPHISTHLHTSPHILQHGTQQWSAKNPTPNSPPPSAPTSNASLIIMVITVC